MRDNLLPQIFNFGWKNYEDISSDTLSRGIEGIEAIEQIGYEIGNIFKKDHKPK